MTGFRVLMVCTANHCRSPMAEKMFAHEVSERGLAGVVRVTKLAGKVWWPKDSVMRSLLAGTVIL